MTKVEALQKLTVCLISNYGIKSSFLTLATGKGLQNLTGEQLAEGMQATPQNPLVGTQDRAALLQRLGSSLLNFPEIFGPEGRPGNVVGMKPPVVTLQVIRV